MINVAEPSINPQNIKAVLLSADDIKIASSILYNAYFDDPLFKQIFQADDDGYEVRLRAAIREELYILWETDQPMVGLFDGDRLLALTCVCRPNHSAHSGRYWHWRLRMLLTAGFFGTNQMVEKEQRIRDAMPADYFHIVAFIAVYPQYQSLGLGHILMQAIDEVVAQESGSQGVGVFATVPKYRRFFEDGGYAQVTELKFGRILGDIMFKNKSD